MRMKYPIIILSIFFLSTQVAAFVPTGEVLSPDGQVLAELSDFGLTGSEIAFAPGSSIMVYDPLSEGERVVWLSNVEPTSVTWKIYDPTLHKVGEDTHKPSFKVQGSFEAGGVIYEWAYADQWEFTVPAFAGKGNWLLSPSYRMADGTTRSGAYTYYAVPVTKDDWIASIFTAPWYLLGFRMPALFIFPGIIGWFPAAFYGFSFGFPTFVEKMTESVRKVRGALPKIR